MFNHKLDLKPKAGPAEEEQPQQQQQQRQQYNNNNNNKIYDQRGRHYEAMITE
jgi:hypothetical protein